MSLGRVPGQVACRLLAALARRSTPLQSYGSYFYTASKLVSLGPLTSGRRGLGNVALGRSRERVVSRRKQRRTCVALHARAARLARGAAQSTNAAVETLDSLTSCVVRNFSTRDPDVNLPAPPSPGRRGGATARSALGWYRPQCWCPPGTLAAALKARVKVTNKVKRYPLLSRHSPRARCSF